MDISIDTPAQENDVWTPHMDNMPDELLIEIFKWIPFEELHTRVALVCRRWRKITSSLYLYPRTVRIAEDTSRRKIVHVLSAYGGTISEIEFRNVYESRIATSLNLKYWSNLKRVSMKWRRHRFPVPIPISRLNWVIDRCPELRCLELRECFVHGDMDAFAEKIQERVREITYVSKYLSINGIEKLFALKNMTKFVIRCYHNADSNVVAEFLRNNQRSLKCLGLRLNTSTDVIANCIAKCGQLRELRLAGVFEMSPGLKRIAELPKLRCLEIELRSISSQEFAEFLNMPFTGYLSSLGIRWNRPADQRELRSIANCANLIDLSIWFKYNDDEILDSVVYLVRILKLKKFEIICNFSCTEILPYICSIDSDLFCIKLTQRCQYTNKKSFKMPRIEGYQCQCSFRKTELKIKMKKIREDFR